MKISQNRKKVLWKNPDLYLDKNGRYCSKEDERFVLYFIVIVLTISVLISLLLRI